MSFRKSTCIFKNKFDLKTTFYPFCTPVVSRTDASNGIENCLFGVPAREIVCIFSRRIPNLFAHSPFPGTFVCRLDNDKSELSFSGHDWNTFYFRLGQRASQSTQSFPVYMKRQQNKCKTRQK